MPHAMCSLCPIITPGTPGTETPQTLNSPVLKCTICQIDGDVAAKCGSLANMGLPEVLSSPFTTQLLLPTCPSPPAAASARRILLRTSVRIAISDLPSSRGFTSDGTRTAP